MVRRWSIFVEEAACDYRSSRVLSIEELSAQNVLFLQCLDLSHAPLVAWSAAETSSQKGFDQFPGECNPDYFPAETKDIHVVVFDTLMGGENIVDERGTHTGNLARGDGRSYTAAAERHPPLNFARRDGPRQRNDEVWVVISGVQSVRAEVHDFVRRAA
jgi:hypothetical protein